LPSGKRHYRLTLADAFSAHERALRTGGFPGIRYQHQIEAAIARPYSGYHRAISKKAAVLVQSVSGNHGFVDGNKRTAIILAHLLIQRSGYQLVSADLDLEIEQMVLNLECHRLTLGQAVEWFRQRLHRA